MAQNFDINLKLDLKPLEVGIFSSGLLGVVIFLFGYNLLLALALYVAYGNAFSYLVWRDGNLVQEAHRLSTQSRYLRDKAKKIVFGTPYDTETGLRKAAVAVVIGSAWLNLSFTWPQYVANWLWSRKGF